MEIIRYTIGPVQANCYILVAEDSGKAVVIDPGQEIEPVLEAIHDLEVKLILLSHGHFDHIAGAAALKKATDAPVLIHAKEEQWPTNPELNGSLWAQDICPVPVTGPNPDELFKDGEELSWGGPAIVCLHTPGHTPGGTSFYVPDEGSVFTGDALFAGSIGRTDLPGGDTKELLDSIREKLFTLPPDTTVHAGHSGPTTIGHERDHNPFLKGRD